MSALINIFIKYIENIHMSILNPTKDFYKIKLLNKLHIYLQEHSIPYNFTNVLFFKYFFKDSEEL